jgi:lipopolysaccharide assembly outer membrane protein LptD (OstA)
MKGVVAKFYLKDDTVLTVISDEGLYNNISLDMNFRKNIQVDYSTHTMFADLLSYSNSNAKLIATGNVRGESIKKGEFSADNVEYDLTNKNLNFSMSGSKRVNVIIKE